MSIDNFFLDNALPLETKEVFVSKRFKSPFIIKPVSEFVNMDIKKNCQKDNDGNIDIDDYLLTLVSKSIVDPDLKNKDLQSSYGVIGVKNLLKTMLTAGEFSLLISNVEQICGFNNDINKDAEKIKN
ncbi:MAG: phage tail assembly chaperone [Oscillospiraceae bacterium]